MSNIQRKYTVLPDSKDARDYLFKATRYTADTLPTEVDLRPHLSPIVDQGSIGSCVANAIASGLREYMEIAADKPLTHLSRLFLYWHERDMEGTVNVDSGAYIRDGMKVLQTIGCAPEVDFPYVESKFTNKPTDQAEAHAAVYKIAEYHRVTSYDNLLHALAEGSPVVLGISVYESFESPDVALRGMIPVPKSSEQLLGGHAVLAVGYKTFSDGVQYILVRNSWGTNWGQFGYCWMPKGFFTGGFVSDMWTGTAQIDAEKMTFDQAVGVLIEKKIFNSPDFWKSFEAKYKAGTLTNADFEYVFLAFQKFAAYLQNN